ncbi:MAG TPA: hypothetical protein ENG10_04730 [Candidatus Bathyarchaeota archaeon]|nr:hypothetical protein [Candidatus Bathyarchaeota archaeon]HEX69580.1 hypothetical protein [Candidatus Bathyarchaeota archaeon]
MAEEKKADEAMEEMPKEFMWFTIRMVPKDTFEEFKAWCKEHAGNKMNVGLRMLLDLAKLSFTTAALFEKIGELEERIKRLEGGEAKPSFPATLGSKKEEEENEQVS